MIQVLRIASADARLLVDLVTKASYSKGERKAAERERAKRLIKKLTVQIKYQGPVP